MAAQQAKNPGSAVAVGITSTPVAEAAGPYRKRSALYVTNDSDTVIYLHLAADGAGIGKGIRLNPNGGHFNTEFTGYRGAVCAIHGGTGTKNLTVAEV